LVKCHKNLFPLYLVIIIYIRVGKKNGFFSRKVHGQWKSPVLSGLIVKKNKGNSNITRNKVKIFKIISMDVNVCTFLSIFKNVAF